MSHNLDFFILAILSLYLTMLTFCLRIASFYLCICAFLTIVTFSRYCKLRFTEYLTILNLYRTNLYLAILSLYLAFYWVYISQLLVYLTILSLYLPILTLSIHQIKNIILTFYIAILLFSFFCHLKPPKQIKIFSTFYLTNLLFVFFFCILQIANS